MNRYVKGANFEREIVSTFWMHGWAAVRAAGSGGCSYPVPDVVALKDGRIVAVECKTTTKDHLSLKSDVLKLKTFIDICGGGGYLAVKFRKKEPRFYEVNNIISRGNYTISLSDVFISFETVLAEQKTL